MEVSQSTETRLKNPILKQYLHKARAQSVLTPEQERALAHKVRQGSGPAADALIDANFPYVVELAFRFENMGLGLPDLIAEGTVGLMGAVRTFDEREDGRFTPYALNAARKRIRAAIRA
ncbi:hypothetical protein KJ682_09625 [bacterium]|nr:hypothetical protein [bacterium]